MGFPRLLLVRQNFPDRALADVQDAVRRELAASAFASRFDPGARVAIGVGSRGIRNIATIVHCVVQYWKEQGAQPFLFPAMGSHGGATAEGQAALLAHYGITASAMGCPLVSQLDVVQVGRTADGIEAFMDKAAYAADGVMLVGRVKRHTDFAGKIESGLFKMMAIGLSKLAGARLCHAHALRLGLEHVIRTVGREVLRSGKIVGGLAILEDANHNTAKIEAVPVEIMERREEENLALAKSWMGKIPVDLDVLVVDEMGKDISGTGMDTKVINRSVRGEYNPWPDTAAIQRVFVREMSAHGGNNALGIGMADLTTLRLARQIDWEATRINALTSTSLAAVRLPLHFPTDRECLERAAGVSGRIDPAAVTYGWIRNTMELGRLALSENVRGEIEKNPSLAIESSIDFEFDAGGNLISPFGGRETAADGG